MDRFLRPTGPDTWAVYLDGEIVGHVRKEGVWYAGPSTDDWMPGFKSTTARGNIPMPDGSVLSTDDRGVPHFYEKRIEPVHPTMQEAAECIVTAVETGRILSAQIAYERANGWSTD